MPGDNTPPGTGAAAHRDVLDQRGSHIHVHGNASFGGGSAVPAPLVEMSNIPPLSPTFVPRKPVTAKIHAVLESGRDTGVMRQAAARAHGGFGKTVAAILYAHEYAAFYTGGRFFLSMERGDIATQLASLGRFFAVPAAAPIEQAALAVKDCLERCGPALLILDNIVNAEQWSAIVETGLVPRGNCRVLITTRAEHIPATTDVPVGRLTKDEAREVYKRFCNGVRSAPEDAVADQITEWLVGLAVAVAAVAARMRLLPHVEWPAYWSMLRTLQVDQLPDVHEDVRAELGLSGRALEDYKRTLRVIDGALDALPQAERRAVEYAALLPEDMVPSVWLEALLEADAARDDGPQKIVMTAPPDDPTPAAKRVLMHLDRLDVLLPKGEDGKLQSLHRLWRARVNERAKERTVDRTPLLLAIADCAAARWIVIVGSNTGEPNRSVDNPAAMTDQSLRWELTPLAEMCKAFWKMGHSGSAARIGMWLTNVLRLLGRLAEAAACVAISQENEAAVLRIVGSQGLGVLFANLSLVEIENGNLTMAQAAVLRSIQLEEGILGSEHYEMAVLHSNLAMIQHRKGDLPGAKISIEKAIAIQSRHFAADHPNLAISYSNLALIQQDDGDLPGARASMEKAMAIKSKLFDPNHPTFAISYNNLAHICLAENNRAEACANFKRALDIFLKHFDENHANVKTVRRSMLTVGCTE